MKRHFIVSAVVGVALLSPLALRAEEMGEAPAAPVQETSQPEAKDEKPAKPIRLINPWTKLTTLSDEQKVRIHAIHTEFLASLAELRKNERERIMAVLTDEQKQELQAALDKEAADRKVRAAERKARAADPGDDDGAVAEMP